MNLPENERLIIMFQYWFLNEQLSKTEFAEKISISKEKINGITIKIINKLKRMECLKEI
jgi:DNA-directed RNA polymerase specialized sigma subunit